MCGGLYILIALSQPATFLALFRYRWKRSSEHHASGGLYIRFPAVPNWDYQELHHHRVERRLETHDAPCRRRGGVNGLLVWRPPDKGVFREKGIVSVTSTYVYSCMYVFTYIFVTLSIFQSQVHWERFQENWTFWTQCGVTVDLVCSRKKRDCQSFHDDQADLFIYMNTCWVPHLWMSPRHFTMVYSMFSAFEQTCYYYYYYS